MKIILLSNINNLGQIGEVIEVKSGYARNYLIPTGKAVLATIKNIAFLEQQKKTKNKKNDVQILESIRRINAIKSLEVLNIFVQAKETGKLFGSIGPLEIMNELIKLGFQVHKTEIYLEDGPIRKLGYYKVFFQPNKKIFHELLVHICLKK